MNASYYAMKRRLGGVKWTARDKRCFHWYPCPGCNGHGRIVGARRARILFERYQKLDNKAHLVYWRTHPKELAAIREQNGIL
jgi:hypothetical protein